MADVSESVQTLLDKVTPARRRRDAETLLELMARATGESPQVYYGTGIGYGQYHYKYKSGREGDAAAAGFAREPACRTLLAGGPTIGDRRRGGRTCQARSCSVPVVDGSRQHREAAAG